MEQRAQIQRKWLALQRKEIFWDKAAHSESIGAASQRFGFRLLRTDDDTASARELLKAS